MLLLLLFVCLFVRINIVFFHLTFVAPLTKKQNKSIIIKLSDCDCRDDGGDGNDDSEMHVVWE